jgi:hypothetical protein
MSEVSLQELRQVHGGCIRVDLTGFFVWLGGLLIG